MCKEQLKGTYASSANEMPVKLLQEIHQALKASKLLNKLKDVKVTFSTIDQQSIHPQHGVPQMYYDQLQVIAQHIFDIQHLADIHPAYIQHLHEHNITKVINKLKQKHNHFTFKKVN